MINLATLNTERKARMGNMWISVQLNDREPYRFRATLPGNAKAWLEGRGLSDDEQGGFELIAMLVDPAQQDQFRADCADTSIEFGIDAVTLSRVNQALTEIYAGKDPSALSGRSSGSPSHNGQN